MRYAYSHAQCQKLFSVSYECDEKKNLFDADIFNAVEWNAIHDTLVPFGPFNSSFDKWQLHKFFNDLLYKLHLSKTNQAI